MDIALGIMFTVLSKENITAQELSSKYLISVRTVYRYVNFLDLCGIPIVTKSGRNGGIKIVNSFSLKNMFFNTPELIALITATSNIENKTLQTNIQTKLLYLLHKHT